MRLAISWPKNLRDILCKTDLPPLSRLHVTDILKIISDRNKQNTKENQN